MSRLIEVKWLYYLWRYNRHNLINNRNKIKLDDFFMALDIDSNRAELDKTELNNPAVLRLAFRPLFLVGTLFSVVAIGWWIYYWLAPFAWTPYGGAIWWHGHEMLFGFGIAIMTGFLLTAVKTWTGVPGLKGMLLGSFVLVWVSGRILISFGNGFPPWIIALVDVSYLLIAAIAMAYPVIKVKQWRNLMFVPILLVLAFFNAFSHWSVMVNQSILTTQSLHATIMLFVLIIALLGGRVIPAFTANSMGKAKLPAIMLLDFFAIVSIVVMTITAFIGFSNVDNNFLLIIATIAAISNGMRFLRWGFQHTWSTPILWSLHLFFLFIPFGFVMLALYAAGFIDNLSAALHSFTVGSIGGMILAMISRVTLGHTGREMKPHRLVTVAFVSLLIAVIVRVILPAWLADFYSMSIVISGGFWMLSFSFYLYVYAPMLVTTRADGGAG